MKKNLLSLGFRLLVVSLFASSIAVKAQQPPEYVWAKKLGGSDNDAGKSIAVDRSGNVYTAGYFQDTAFVDFGTNVQKIISNGNYDAFIVKQDASGNLLWVKSFGGLTSDIASAIAVDDSGNVYITGYYTGTVDFDPGPGTTSHTSAVNTRGSSSQDFYLSKFDSSGKFLWVKVAGGSGGENGSAVSLDPASGTVLVTGIFSGKVDFGLGGTSVYLTASGNDAFVLKVKNTGDLVWAENFGGTASVRPAGICVGPSGTVYLTGNFSGTIDFDPDPSNAVTFICLGNTDAFVSRLDSSGKLIWAKAMGGVDADAGQDIVADEAGNAYFTGSFQNTANFDPNGSFNLNSVGAADIFVAKLDKDGKLIWAKNAGCKADDFGEGIALDKSGNVYSTGAFQGPGSDFNPGLAPEDTFNLVSYGGFDIYILKLNNSGDFEWAVNMGASMAPDWGYDIAVSTGYIYTTGVFYKTADFDPAGPGLHQLTAYEMLNSDVFILKLRDCLSVTDSALVIKGPDSICKGSAYVYTVPEIPGALNYSWTLPSGWTGSSTSDSITVVANNSGTVSVVIAGACDTARLSLDVVLAMPEANITVDGFILGTTNKGSYYSWQWYLEGQKIPGATDSTYTVNKNGTYSVVVTGRKGCADTAFYEVTNYTAINPVKTAATISIYPNPVTNVIYIRAPFPVGVSLAGIDGRVIRSEYLNGNIKTIKTSKLSPGMYLLHISDEQGRLLKVEKLIKVQ